MKKKLWGGEFWTDGYYVATVSEHGNEEVIANYVKNQGNEYKRCIEASKQRDSFRYSIICSGVGF